MAYAKGLELLQCIPKLPVDLTERQQSLRLNRVCVSAVVQPAAGQCIQLVMQSWNILGQNGETTGGRMATVPLQKAGALP